ncbi:hypothetical protein F5Y10DRAFT_263983 [Nemania abortiva]|nr:hypothetical protein F5Y10DRAFT_263983 [Nemania abortiva]
MSSRILHATRLLTRRRQQLFLAGCIGLSAGTGIALRSSPRIRFDSPSPPSPPPPPAFSTSSSPAYSPAYSSASREETLDPDLMRQLSGGSVAGFLSGLPVSVFSRTLVLLIGVSVVIVQVAASYGIDIVNQLRLKQRLGKSRVLAALEKDPVFKVSFGLFFALSAFMQF